MEIWKDIKGMEDYYQISSYGNVRSKDRYVNHNYGGLKLLKSKIRKLTLCGNNTKYLKVDLWPLGKQYTIHRLVAEHFLSNPNNYPLVMHLDNDGTNNNVNNLKWGTYSMNAKHAVEAGRWNNQYTIK
jgi:hypothetical protein